MTFSDDRFDPAIHTVTLNGKTGGRDVARAWIEALNNPKIVIEKAGFLFKASVKEDHLYLAATPVLINGQRSHHYDQHLNIEDAYTLVGDVNAEGVFTILFKPENRPLRPEQEQRYIRSFRRFAGWLLSAGYCGHGTLSDVTRMVLEELGLSPAPATLMDL